MATLVTFESVATAAEALTAAGKRASVRNVIAELGGGSPNTVLQLINEWKSGRPVVRITDVEIDAVIISSIKAQAQRMAEKAALVAEEKSLELEENLQTMTATVTALNQQIATLTNELDESKQQNLDLTEEMNNAAADAARDTETAKDIEKQLRLELATERAKFEATFSDLAKANVRLEDLPAMRAELERLKGADQDAAVATAKFDLVSGQLAKAESTIETLTAKLDVAAREHLYISATAQKGQLGLEAVTRELDDCKASLNTAQANAKKFQDEISELKASKKTVKPETVTPAPVATSEAKKGRGRPKHIKSVEVVEQNFATTEGE